MYKSLYTYTLSYENQLWWKMDLPTILAWQVGPQLKFSQIGRLYLHLQKSTMQGICSQHLSHISELKKPKQNRQSKTSSCHMDSALMIQSCYQTRLSDNRRFLLSNLSQHKTLSNSDSALRKGQQWIGSRSKPLAPSLPTKSGGICAVSSALPSGAGKWHGADGVWSSAAGTGHVDAGLYLQEVQCSWGCSKPMEEIFEMLA